MLPTVKMIDSLLAEWLMDASGTACKLREVRRFEHAWMFDSPWQQTVDPLTATARAKRITIFVFGHEYHEVNPSLHRDHRT